MELISSLISAGSSLLGGLLNRKSAKKQVDQNTALQREFAQNGIQWRVADAKKAGLHPLYALGGGGATYSPSPITTHMGDAVAQAGQAIGGAMSRQAAPEQSAVQQAQLAALSAAAQKDQAAAGYYDSMAARTRESQPGMQNGLGTFSYPVRQSTIEGQDLPPLAAAGAVAHSLGGSSSGQATGAIKFKPAEITSKSSPGEPHIQAGEHAMYVQYAIGTNSHGQRIPMLLPYSDEGPMESLTQMPFYMLPAWYKANVQKYGPEWADQVIRYSHPTIADIVRRIRTGRTVYRQVPPYGSGRSHGGKIN